MYFNKIQLHNYGIYKGTHTIDLQKSSGGRNITLIGGMNGFGKTTILDAIFLSLYGKRAIKVIQDKNISYNSLLKSHINKSAVDGETYVSISLVIDNEENTVVVKRSWNQKNKETTERLQVIRAGKEDIYLSENWDFYVEDILPLGIARFFFFDNEKIGELADDDTFEKIKDSIKVIIGVTTIEKLIDDMRRVIKNKQSSLKTVEDGGLKSRLEETEKQLSEVEREISIQRLNRSSCLTKLERVKIKLEETERDFWRQGGNLGLKRDEIQQEKMKLLAASRVLKQEILELVSSSATPLGLCIDLIKQIYNKAKDNEKSKAIQYSEPIVKIIYKRLSEKVDELFAGKSIYGTLKELIDNEFKNYKTSPFDNHAIDLTPVSTTLLENLITDGLTQIYQRCRNTQEQIENTENALLQIDAHLNNNAEQAGALSLMNMIKEFEGNRGHLASDLEKIDENLRSLDYQIKTLGNQRDQVIRQATLLENGVEDNSRILKYASITIDVMNEFKTQLQKRKVHELEGQIIKCFNFLAQKESIISSVNIDYETLNITLKDYNGGELLKSQLSAGEKQMFAISILWGLALSSGYNLPVVIDTPLARLDSAHRSNFVNRYLPNASEQVIVLSTDEELYGKYLDQAKEHIIAYYTLFYDKKEKCTTIIPGYFERDVR